MLYTCKKVEICELAVFKVITYIYIVVNTHYVLATL